MKIWFPLIRTATGSEVYVRQLAQGLAERGHEIVVSEAPQRYQYYPWLAGLRAPEGCDVIFGNSWNAAAFAGAAPLVTVIHHLVHDPVMRAHKTLAQKIFHAAFVKPMELAAVRKSAEVVVVSETTARSVRAHLADIPLTTILNGVDTRFYTPGPRPERELAEGPVKLLFVGKPTRRKGFERVTELMRVMGQDARLTCVGSAGESGLELPAGDYLGRLSDEELREVYRKADFLILPSRLEGFGYVAAEAMACGTPVICSADGAVAEVVDPPSSALVIDDGCNALAARLRELRNRPQDYAEMRMAARTRAETALDQRRWLDQMEEMLLRVAGR